MKRFEGKSGIIIGASRGIGASIALRLASEGANLILTSRSSKIETVATIKREHEDRKDKVFAVSCDVMNEDDIKKVVDTCVKKFGKIDFAINNAGTPGEAAKIEDFDVKNYDLVFGTNTKAVFLSCKYEIKAMKETLGEGQVGSIVNIGSVMGVNALQKGAGLSTYSASKAAMEMITKYAAIECAKKVRVNSCLPGIIKTGLTDNVPDEFVKSSQFIGRKGTPEEVASMVAFIASDEASLVTGASYSVDGGWTLT